MSLDNFWIANLISLSVVVLFLFQSAALGSLMARSLFRLAWRVAFPRQMSPLLLLIVTICGAMTTGLLFFSLSHLRMGLGFAAWLWTVLTLGLFLWKRTILATIFRETLQGLRGSWDGASPLEKRTALVVFFLACIRSLSTTAPQTHGDQYLYHLTVVNLWEARGFPAIDPLNVTTGYSWTMESLYAYLFQFLGKGVLHILAAQQLHCALGFFGLLLVMYKINRMGLSRFWSLLLLLPFMTPYITQMAFFAKNDALAFLLAWLVLWATLQALFFTAPESRSSQVPSSSPEPSPVQLMVLLAPFLLAAKITTALGCAVIGLLAMSRRLWVLGGQASLVSQETRGSRDARAVTSLGLWVRVGLLATLGIVPYLVATALQTGNPLFPILNNIFRSPLMPASAQATILEMNPLGSGPLDVLWGSWLFVQEHPALLLLPVALFLTWRHSTTATRVGFHLLGVGVLALVVLQVFLNAYGTAAIEQRHFKLASYALMTGTFLICSQIGSRSWRNGALTLGLVLGVTRLQLEVNVRDLVRRIREPDLRTYIFEQKPLYPLLAEINRDPLYCPDCSVYAAGVLVNEAYFLDRGHFLHDSISAPLIAAGGLERVPAVLEDLNQKSRITHAVISDKAQDLPGSLWVKERMKVVGQSGHLTLYRLSSAPEGGAVHD